MNGYLPVVLLFPYNVLIVCIEGNYSRPIVIPSVESVLIVF